MSKDVRYVDRAPLLLRVEVERNKKAQIASVRVTTYEQRDDMVLDERDAEVLIDVLCPKAP